MKKILVLIPILMIFYTGIQAQGTADYSVQFTNNPIANKAVALPDSNIYYPSKGGFTWEMWVNPDSIPRGNDAAENPDRAQPFLAVGDGVPAEDISIGMGWGNFNEDYLVFAVDGQGGGAGRDFNAPHYILPQTHRWYYVVGVCNYDSGYTRLYVDGQVIGTSYFMHNHSFYPLTRKQPITMANSLSQPGNGYSGLLDEVMIWGYPKSNGDVLADMDGCFTGTETGLIAYYKLNEGTGTFTKDETPHHLDGTFLNGAGWYLDHPAKPCLIEPTRPKAKFNTPDTVICVGSSITFNDLSLDTPTSWHWTFTGGTPGTSTNQSPLVTYNAAGTYNVKLVVANAYGKDSLTKTAYIKVIAPTVNGTVSANPDTICSGGTTQLSYAGVTGTMRWQSSTSGNNFTDINGANSTPYTTGSLQQTTYFRAVVSGGSCDFTSQPVKVLVNPLPAVLTPGNSIICSSDSIKISTTGTYASYHWNNNDTRSYTYAKQAGGYWVTVADANGCTAVSNHVTISVLPVPSISIVVQGDTLGSFNAATYQWYLNDQPIDGATEPVYIARENGDYSLQITDVNGCTALSTKVHVGPTGIENLYSNGQLSIHPNPFNHSLFIQIKGTGIEAESVDLYDIVGRTILSKRINNSASAITLDVPELADGMYIVKVRTNDGEYVQKMMRQ